MDERNFLPANFRQGQPSRRRKRKEDRRSSALLIDLHIADMKSVGKAPWRSKAATLKMMKARLSRKKIAQLDRQLFIDFGRERVTEGAGSAIDVPAVRSIWTADVTNLIHAVGGTFLL